MKAFSFPKAIFNDDRAIARRLLDTTRRNILPLLFIAGGMLQVILFVQVILLTIWVAKLARKPAPTLVEMANGASVAVTEKDPLYRSPESIKQFVTTTMVPLFSWSSVLPPRIGGETGKSERDPGVSITGSGLGAQKLTTPAWEASFALSESFRRTFVERLANLIPRSVFMGSTKTLLVVNRISEPEEIEPGHWKVNIIANLFTFQGSDRVGAAVPFNKLIYVQAVYPQPLLSDGSNSDVARVVARIRSAGLEAYRISDLKS